MKAIVSGVLLLAIVAGIAERSMAQVLPDSTLGTQVTQAGSVFGIDQGTRSGNNLFHSFSQFSVPTGGSAVFNNATSIQNIFGRVTGGSVSSIDGLIKTNGSANLFLLNPNGILFGPKAKLDIGGSFVSTTAKSVRFADGQEFSATEHNSTPLLTISTPIGLQFGTQATPITHRSTTGLQTRSGQTLAFIGGNLQFEGGKTTAPSGRIELGSVATNSFVGLTLTHPGVTFHYDTVTQFQNIHLTQAAKLEASGTQNAGIQIQGQRVSFREGATAVVSISAAVPGQGITIRAADSIELVGVSADRKTQSGLTSTVLAGAQGKGGDIRLEAPFVKVWDGARVNTRTFGDGWGGNLIIRAQALDVKGRDSTEANTSELTARVESKAKGQGGNILIEAQSVQIRDGAAIKLRTQGSGNSGNLLMRATNVEFSGRSAKGSETDISTNSREDATGNGGTLMIEADQVTLQGTSIRARTYAVGAAGNIHVQARSLTVVDSRITTESDALASGPGGYIQLNADTIKFIDGGRAVASTSGSGNAGNIEIAAQSLEISGRSPSTTPMSQQDISTLQALSDGQGNAGTVNVKTGQLIVQEGANISVSGDSKGNAGNLIIHADMIQLDNGGRLLADSNAGSQGNINIQTHQLRLRHGSNITTNAYNQANGGSITIQAPVIVGLENSDIAANAFQGKGGNIKITTQGILGLHYRDRLTPGNDITASSDFGINGNVQVNIIGINPTNTLIVLPTNIVDSSREIANRCGAARSSSFIATGRGGIPHNPSQKNRTDRVWHDMRAQIASSSVPPVALSNPIEPLIEASAIQVDQSGSITLVAPHSIGLPAAATCAMK